MGLEDLQPSACPPLLPCPSRGACHTHSCRQHPDDPAVPLIPTRHVLSGAGAPWVKPAGSRGQGPGTTGHRSASGVPVRTWHPLAGGQRGVQKTGWGNTPAESTV